MINTTCPACSQPAMAKSRKCFLGPILPVTCHVCGRPLRLSWRPMVPVALAGLLLLLGAWTGGTPGKILFATAGVSWLAGYLRALHSPPLVAD